MRAVRSYLNRPLPALMPYKNDPRRTVTLNLSAAEYAALSEDALQAGYASAGTYALALVRARGEAPAPILDQRGEERLVKAQGAQRWLQAQFEALRKQVVVAGLPFSFVELDLTEPAPRSWSAQERAVRQAVKKALAQERAQAASSTTRAAKPTSPE